MTPYPSTANLISPMHIAAGYAEMAAQYIEDGWAPYLLTFMFQRLSGGPSAIARQMERDVERVYSRFVTRVVRNPRSALEIGWLPVWICSPDYPVFKHAKQTLHDLTVNDGRHMHAVHLQPPRSRLKLGVDEHFEEAQDLYVRPGSPLLRVHSVAITHDSGDVVEYVLKAMLRGLVGEDATLILPRSRSEMPAD
ncbi:hypothetical protein [Methylorubrum extorquens]